jgi:sortase (surface protein transpeptidase)
MSTTTKTHPRLSRSGKTLLALLVIAIGIGGIIWALNPPSRAPYAPKPFGVTNLSTTAAHVTTSTTSTSSFEVAAPASLSAATPAVLVSSPLATTPVPRAAKAKPSTSTVHPVAVSIPAIGVSSKLQDLGRTSTGALAVPTSWYEAGWYKYGAVPGSLGTAVIAGHVDSISGPAIFYRLSQLREGDKVSVKLSSGKTVHFSVIGLRIYAKNKFPTSTVFGARSYHALNLITCAGSFDYSTGHYLSNLIVFTAQTK